jgi:hypothetical protein
MAVSLAVAHVVAGLQHVPAVQLSFLIGRHCTGLPESVMVTTSRRIVPSQLASLLHSGTRATDVFVSLTRVFLDVRALQLRLCCVPRTAVVLLLRRKSCMATNQRN